MQQTYAVCGELAHCSSEPFKFNLIVLHARHNTDHYTSGLHAMWLVAWASMVCG